jgi:hypothetical protein
MCCSCLREASLGGTPFAMRMLFVSMVLHCCPTDPRALLDEFWEFMAGPNWSKERLLRYLARKVMMNNSDPDKELFRGIDLEHLDEEEDELEQDEGVHAYVPPAQEEMDGLCCGICCCKCVHCWFYFCLQPCTPG